MPSEIETLADLVYDATSVWTAFGTLFLPLCFFWHARRHKDRSLPGFLKELQGQSWRTAIMLFRRRWWHIPFFAVAFGALSYLPYFFPEALESDIVAAVFESKFWSLYSLLISATYRG